MSKQLCVPDTLSHFLVSAPTPEDDILGSDINFPVWPIVTLQAAHFLVDPSKQEDNSH